MKTKITPFRDRKQNKSFILDEPFDKALKMTSTECKRKNATFFVVTKIEENK
jgi:hypothetical protein